MHRLAPSPSSSWDIQMGHATQKGPKRHPAGSLQILTPWAPSRFLSTFFWIGKPMRNTYTYIPLTLKKTIENLWNIFKNNVWKLQHPSPTKNDPLQQGAHTSLDPAPALDAVRYWAHRSGGWKPRRISVTTERLKTYKENRGWYLGVTVGSWFYSWNSNQDQKKYPKRNTRCASNN